MQMYPPEKMLEMTVSAMKHIRRTFSFYLSPTSILKLEKGLLGMLLLCSQFPVDHRYIFGFLVTSSSLEIKHSMSKPISKASDQSAMAPTFTMPPSGTTLDAYTCSYEFLQSGNW